MSQHLIDVNTPFFIDGEIIKLRKSFQQKHRAKMRSAQYIEYIGAQLVNYMCLSRGFIKKNYGIISKNFSMYTARWIDLPFIHLIITFTH